MTRNENNGFDRLHPEYKSQKNVEAFAGFTYEKIDTYLKERNITYSANSRYGRGKKILNSIFIANAKSVDFDVEIDEVKYAITDYVQMKAIIENYTQLRKLPKNLQTAFFKDALLPNGSSSQGRNFLFEHFIGARFSAAGCKVWQGEPDFICMHDGEKFGVAAKKLKLCNLEARISSAKKQIMDSRLPGVIVLDLSHDLLDTSGIFYQNSYEEYLNNLHESMDINFLGVLRRKWERWGLIRASIPAVIAFHIGAFFDQELQRVRTVVHMTTFLTGPDKPMAARDQKSNSAIMQSIEKLRDTLVDPD